MLSSILAFVVKPDAIRSALYMVGGAAGVEVSQDVATQIVSGIVGLSGLIHALEQLFLQIKAKKRR